MSDLMSYLFETNAIRFCEENKPFWYTSGKIGPYFINTHFVYGNEKDATQLLSFIDECLADKLTLPERVFEKVLKQYQTNEIYKTVIDTMVQYIQDNIDISEIDYISGGERRDWFFSNMIAYILNKPHLSIYKDLSVVESDCNFMITNSISSLSGKRVLHIADLITVASSYIRAWIPAVTNLGAQICWSCVVVDRMQGGKEKIEAEGVKSLSLVQVDKNLFERALDLNIINEAQVSMLNDFFENPDESMKQFLINHPEFLEHSLNADEKTRKRAQLLIDSNLYGLN
ncbi:MAG: orotate phosphoribosyltransferase [Clostridia bacterium]|nr:orotate phosphoribosyltransferase [Clostridia bacterium]